MDLTAQCQKMTDGRDLIKVIKLNAQKYGE